MLARFFMLGRRRAELSNWKRMQMISLEAGLPDGMAI